jgi:hypothetical protein
MDIHCVVLGIRSTWRWLAIVPHMYAICRAVRYWSHKCCFHLLPEGPCKQLGTPRLTEPTPSQPVEHPWSAHTRECFAVNTVFFLFFYSLYAFSSSSFFLTSFLLLLLRIVTCISDYRRDSNLVNRFIEHSQVVTTSNYNSLTGLHTLKITVTTEHKIKSSMSVFTRRFLVT